MPNWVYNTLTISADKDTITRIEGELEKPHPIQLMDDMFTQAEGKWEMSSPGFSFWNVVAPPEDKWAEYFGVSGTVKGERLGDGEYNWYNWNCNNWGTKWDACEPDVDSTDDMLTYRFDTAWSPPLDVFEKLCAKYPEVHFEMEYQEEQGWGGIAASTGDGGSYLQSEWDIPGSHEEWANIEREDSCPCNWSDEDAYDDCPKKEESVGV